MNLDLINDLVNRISNNSSIQVFLKELQKNIERNKAKREDILLNNDEKMVTEFRDKMLIERAHILNEYAKQTSNLGEMYYIYCKNLNMENRYNMCICRDEMNHNVIEIDAENLPVGSQIGSVLRKHEDSFILDEEATEEVTKEIENMKENIMREQEEYLNSVRIEEHIYELSEKSDDRVWLFDTTNVSNEAIEEIDFPKELMEDSQEGDLFIYEYDEYKKYIN